MKEWKKGEVRDIEGEKILCVADKNNDCAECVFKESDSWNPSLRSDYCYDVKCGAFGEDCESVKFVEVESD